MNIEQFIQRAEALHKDLADLYQTASVLPWIPPDLLPQAFKGLYTTSKKVHLAAEELYQRNDEFVQTRNLLETKHQYYQDLFEFAPDGYLVTNTQGIIQEGNRAASQLLNVSQHFLVGKPIINFIPLEEHQRFQNELIQICESETVREILIHLQQPTGGIFDVSLSVGVIHNQQEKTNLLCWLLRDISAHQRLLSTVVNHEVEFKQNRPVHKYSKGETIPLNPLLIWYVCQGLVKLSTFCETGEEVLTGLAAENMVFGSSMTALPIYQATVLLDVELVAIYIAEILVSPSISHILLPKINQRLQQTESFLVIYGRRRVQHRLHHFLKILKQEIGQTVPGGIRLSARFTHEEIASACGTTRVTITRLLGNLQKEGVISFDAKKHMILIDENELTQFTKL